MSRFVVRKHRRGYAVCDAVTGQRVSGFYTDFSAVDVRLGQMEMAARFSRRGCITCGQSFDSEGAHHRMCRACRGRSHDPMMMYVQEIG